jgi:uncharacterized membrane protein
MSGDQETTGYWDKGRVETFSDGVFAIAITLLVLDINVPSDLRHLSNALEHEWPAYLAYVTSFLTVGGVWIAHHRLFSSLRFLDSMMMRINLLLLMTTAFLPFPTKILAEALRAPDNTAQTAVILYGATVLVIELVLLAAARYVASRPDLARARRPDTAIARPNSSGRWWPSATVVLYALAFGVALVDFPKLAAVLYLLLAIRGVLLLERHPRRLRYSEAS